MSNFSAKTIPRKTLGFLNVGSIFRFLAGLPFRRNRVLFIFEGREYTYAQTCAESERYAALFLIERHPDMEIYFRQRGDDTYHPLTSEGFAAIREEFQKTGRLHLLERY